MKPRIKQLILKFLLLQEEYSTKEIDEALSLLKREGSDAILFDYFLGKPQVSGATPSPSKKSEKVSENRVSPAVAKLEGVDPEKFSILSDFERLVRRDEILPRVSDIRELVNSLSKEWPSYKSRRESIPDLMSRLSQLHLDQIKTIFSRSLNETKINVDSSEYHRLANYLITGTAGSKKEK